MNWRRWHLFDDKSRWLLARLIREEARDYFIVLLAWAFMANHFHLITVSPDERRYRTLTSRRTPGRHLRPWPKGHQNASVISQFMREVRRRMSKLRQSELDLTGRFWEGDYDARHVSSPESLLVRIAYDHRNPVKAGIVDRAEDYFWSSARSWRFGEDGPIPIRLDRGPLGLSQEELVKQVLRYEGWKELDEFLPALENDGIDWSSDDGLEAIRKFVSKR